MKKNFLAILLLTSLLFVSSYEAPKTIKNTTYVNSKDAYRPNRDIKSL